MVNGRLASGPLQARCQLIFPVQFPGKGLEVLFQTWEPPVPTEFLAGKRKRYPPLGYHGPSFYSKKVSKTYLHRKQILFSVNLFSQKTLFFGFFFFSFNICNKISFPGGSVVKNPPANAGNVGSIPGLGRSPRGGHSNSLQYSCLGNPMDRGAWRAAVHAAARVGHDSASDYTTTAEQVQTSF